MDRLYLMADLSFSVLGDSTRRRPRVNAPRSSLSSNLQRSLHLLDSSVAVAPSLFGGGGGVGGIGKIRITSGFIKALLFQLSFDTVPWYIMSGGPIMVILDSYLQGYGLLTIVA